MGVGCGRCSTSAVKPASLPASARKKRATVPQLVKEATEAVTVISSTTQARGPQGLGSRLSRAVALTEDVRGEGHEDAAQILEDRLIEDSWPAFERCVPHVASPKAVSSTAEPPIPQTLGCPGSSGIDVIELAEDLRQAAGQLLGLAVRARAGDDGAPAARLVARLAQLDTDVLLALVGDALTERNVRLLKYARDRVAASFDAAGAGGLARSLAARLSMEQDLVRAFEPFEGAGVANEERRGMLEGLRDLLDLVAGTVEAEDEVGQSNLRGDVRDLHAQVLQRLALRTLSGALSTGPPSAGAVDAAAVALEDLRRAVQLSVLEPLDPFGAPTCAAWLELSVLPTVDDADASFGARQPAWVRACFEHQQAALAAAPFLRSIDVAGGLVAQLRGRLEAAAREGRLQAIGVWAHLAAGLEVNVRDMLGIDRGRQVSQSLCASFAECAGSRLLTHAAEQLRRAGDARPQAALESPDGAHGPELELLDESSVRKTCRNCSLALFYCASTLRRSYALTERTCPCCYTFQSLDTSALCDLGAEAQGVAAAAEAELPIEARALRAYACVASAPVGPAGCASAPPRSGAPPSEGQEAAVGRGRPQLPSSGGEMHAAHRGFLEALRVRLQQLAASPRRHVLLACFALRCHVLADLGATASELAAELDSRVAGPGSRLEAEVRAALERYAQAEQEFGEWRQVVVEAVADADAGALRAALVWAGDNPSAQGCEEYLQALDAYRALREVPEDWALADVLTAGEEVAAWRCGARLAAAGGDLPSLRAILREALGRPQFERLAECHAAAEAYRKISRLPESWDLADVMKFDEEVARWRKTAEAAKAAGDHQALHAVLAVTTKASHLEELPEFRELVVRYCELLQLPQSWPNASVLKVGPQLAEWREQATPLLRLGPEEVRSSAKLLDQLRGVLGRARGIRFMEATEEFEAGVRLLRLALNLPDSWTADEVLHRGEEAAAWREAAASAVSTRSPRELVSVLLRARKCRFAQAFPEYHQALACLAREQGTGKKAQPLDLEKLPAAWELEDQPYSVRKDSKGVNVVLRRCLDHFVHSQLLSIIQDIVNKSCQAIRTRDRKEGGKVPLHYSVSLVEHVMNLRSWQVYLRARERIAAKEGGRKIGPLLRNQDLLTRSGPAVQLLREFRAAGGPLHDGLNECLLWHGTLPASAEQIANGDFKLGLAGSHAGTMYGRGIYLAEAFTKSDEYSRRTNARGERSMLLCRCVMGRYNYVDTEPNGRKLEASVLSGAYDSVLGDRRKFRGTYREFIFFDADLVYPAFLVWYKRAADVDG